MIKLTLREQYGVTLEVDHSIWFRASEIVRVVPCYPDGCAVFDSLTTFTVGHIVRESADEVVALIAGAT